MRILVVEDDQLLNKTLSYNLSAVGYSVDGAMSKAVAIRFLEKQDYDLIVLDVNLPDGNGFDICHEVKERRPDTAVIFLTANDMESDIRIAIQTVERLPWRICTAWACTKVRMICLFCRCIRLRAAIQSPHENSVLIWTHGWIRLRNSETAKSPERNTTSGGTNSRSMTPAGAGFRFRRSLICCSMTRRP